MPPLKPWMKVAFGSIAINAVWEWGVKPGAEFLRGEAPTLLSRVLDAPVQNAAMMSASSSPASDLTTVVLIATVIVVGLSLLWMHKHERNEAPTSRAWNEAYFMALVFVITAYGGAIFSDASLHIYQEFHVNLVRALPVLSVSEERQLRSEFALAQTRADVKRIDAELRAKMDLAHIKYYKP